MNEGSVIANLLSFLYSRLSFSKIRKTFVEIGMSNSMIIMEYPLRRRCEERSSSPCSMDISVVGRTVKARQKMEPHSPWRQRAEWLSVLDLKSGGPSFKSSTLMLSGFVLGSPEFNSSTALSK